MIEDVSLCPGIILVFDDASPNVKARHTEMTTVHCTHTHLVIPKVETPSGTVQRTIWALWSSIETRASDDRSRVGVKAASIYSEQGCNQLTFEKIDDAAAERRANAAHYLSLAGLHDLLHQPCMQKHVNAELLTFASVLLVLSLQCAARSPSRCRLKRDAEKDCLLEKHARLIGRLAVEANRFCDAVLATIHKACTEDLGLNVSVGAGPGLAALEEAGWSSLVLLHASSDAYYACTDMGSAEERRLRAHASYTTLAALWKDEASRARTLEQTVKAIFCAAADGDLGRAFCARAIFLQRADEIGCCAQCFRVVDKLQVACNALHLCPHRPGHIVCESCDTDVGCKACYTHARAPDWRAILLTRVVCNLESRLHLEDCAQPLTYEEETCVSHAAPHTVSTPAANVVPNPAPHAASNSSLHKKGHNFSATDELQRETETTISCAECTFVKVPRKSKSRSQKKGARKSKKR